MAKLQITLEDVGDDNVDVQVAGDVPGEDDELTSAQQITGQAMTFLRNFFESEEPGEEGVH